MGFWSWWRPTARTRGVVMGGGTFKMHVVGTSQHQQMLENLCGERTSAGAHSYSAALLTPQPRNRYDRQAVAVTIHGIEVGHLERDTARDFLDALHEQRFADAACEAVIVGGWNRGGDNWGYYEVRLNAFMPFEIVPASQWHGAPPPGNVNCGSSLLCHSVQLLKL